MLGAFAPPMGGPGPDARACASTRMPAAPREGAAGDRAALALALLRLQELLERGDPVAGRVVAPAVDAGATVDDVADGVAGTEDVVAGAAAHHVATGAALEAVATDAALERVVAGVAAQVVVAVAADDHVVAAAAADHVVAADPADH